MRRAATTMMMCAMALVAAAQQDTLVVARQRVTLNATLFGGGWANTYDDYLTPIEYTGWDVAWRHETMRPTHWRGITTQGVWRAHAGRTGNPMRNHEAYTVRLGYQHTWHRAQPLMPGRGDALTLRYGLGVKGDLGGLYLARGGNNPGQVYASAALTASVGADWRFRLWRRPYMLTAQVDAPLLGLMFSPHYAQPYYDLFGHAGHYSRNIVPTWPVNCPTMHAQVAVDIPAWTHTVRIAYTADIIQAKPNNLRQHTYLHNIMIGWVRRLAILKPAWKRP